MADAPRRPIAPVRKLVAAVLATFAAFVVLFGAGMESWAIVAVGFAVLVLAIGLLVMNSIRGGRTWVAGTATVMSASEPPAASTYGRCELQIVIDAPSLPPASIKVRDSRVPIAKWPLQGDRLPIMVAVDDLRHVRILWDDVMTHAEARAAGANRADEYGLDDDMIHIEEDEPPWARRDPDEPFLSPDSAEPVTADLTDELRGIRDEPVVVHQTPGGPIVLEGTLVEPASSDARQVPLPRRAKSTPRSHGGESGNGAATAVADPPAPSAPPPPDEPSTADTGTDRDDSDDAILAELITAYPSARPGPAGAIHGVGVTVLVTDLVRSIAFYRDMLGFFEIDGGEGNAVLASGDTRLVLRVIKDVGPIGPRTIHLNLEVGDVAAMYEDLRAKGVRFTYAPRAVNRGAKLELWAAAFKDPDGHGIAITQWRTRTPDGTP